MSIREDVKELKERLERLESENKELKKQNRRLENELKNVKKEVSPEKTSDKYNEDKGISRRGFLKKLGAGAIGIGALSLAPAASRMTITDSGVQKNGSPAFLDLAGTNAMNSDLDMSNYSVLNPNQIKTGGGGTDSISFYDAANAQNILTVNEGGNVKVPNGQLSEAGNRVATRVWATGSNINHSDLADAPSSAHHAKYTDSAAVSAVESVNLDLSANNWFGLPQVSSDPSASAGQMWYRTDLD